MPEISLQPVKIPDHGTPRRFVSGMRLECRPVPFKYSSSVHLKIGSTKRRYTEEVFYKFRLVPKRYYEGATADFCHEPNPAEKRFVSTMSLECTYQPLILLQMQESIEKRRKRNSSSSSSSSDNPDETDA